MEMEVFRLADLASSFATRMKAREVAELLMQAVCRIQRAMPSLWTGTALMPSARHS